MNGDITNRVCWRCILAEFPALGVGITVGWRRAWKSARVNPFWLRVELAWLYWRCWYWPGYIHPHQWGIRCRHDAMPGNLAAGAMEGE